MYIIAFIFLIHKKIVCGGNGRNLDVKNVEQEDLLVQSNEIMWEEAKNVERETERKLSNSSAAHVVSKL